MVVIVATVTETAMEVKMAVFLTVVRISRQYVLTGKVVFYPAPCS